MEVDHVNFTTALCHPWLMMKESHHFLASIMLLPMNSRLQTTVAAMWVRAATLSRLVATAMGTVDLTMAASAKHVLE